MLRKHQQSVIKTRIFGNFTSLKSRIALQVARKIAPCNMALSKLMSKLLTKADFTLQHPIRGTGISFRFSSLQLSHLYNMFSH